MAGDGYEETRVSSSVANDLAPSDGAPGNAPSARRQATRDSNKASLTRMRIAVVLLVIGVALAGVGGFFAGRVTSTASTSTEDFAADEAKNLDLLKLKSEAEELVVAGKLQEAHAKYRQLTSMAAGRVFRGPLLWDILERAKVDQDRVYWILMARMDGAERAFNIDKPLPGLPTTRFGAPATLPTTWASGRAFPTTSNAASSTAPAVATVARPAATRPTTLVDGTPPPVSGPDRALTSPATTVASSRPKPVPEDGRVPLTIQGVRLAPVPLELALENPAVLDGQVRQAIQGGASYLLSQVNDGELPVGSREDEIQRQGLHALMVYALLTSGQAVTTDTRLRGGDPVISRMLDKLKSYDMRTDPRGGVRPVVVARSFRAAALSVLNRPEDRLQLKDDVEWLTEAHVNGGFSFDDQIRKWKWSAPRPQQPVPGAGQVPLPATRPIGKPPQDPGNKQPRAAFDTYRQLIDHWLHTTPSGTPLLDLDGQPLMLAHGGGHDGRSGRGVGPGVLGVQPQVVVPAPPPPKVVVPAPKAIPPGFDENGKPMWDNLNSQIAVLGVSAGQSRGVAVPAQFWKDVQRHWFDCQHTNGQWSYQSGDNVGSIGMTAGGAASLLMANRYGEATGSRAYPRELERALAWLDQADNAVTIPGPKTMYIGFDLMAVGRVGLASGYKYFGSHDWYRKLALLSVSLQNPDGSWGIANGAATDQMVDTAFHMIFLSQGRHPIMMNKLKWEGAWNRRPQDVANAAGYLSKVVEQPMNWQVVRLDRAGTEWLDAPILYIASDDPPPFSDVEIEHLRRYVQSGGMLLLHADEASYRFSKWAKDLCAKLTPEYPLTDIPADHEVYSVLHKLPQERKRLQMVHNGSRPLVILSPYDIAGSLQNGDPKRDLPAFELMANVWAFANGRTAPRPKLDLYDIPAPSTPPLATLTVVRVRYAGNWNPEPGGWARLSRYLQWESSAAVTTTELEASAITPGAAPLVHLTGTADPQLSDADLAALRAYVEAGGTLLIDASGHSDVFREAVQKRVLAAFPDLRMTQVDEARAPITPTFDVSDDLRLRQRRPFVTDRLGVDFGPLQVGTYGKGRIVYSPMDLSTGLAGSKAWGVAGYTPDHSVGVVKNVLLWAAARQAGLLE